MSQSIDAEVDVTRTAQWTATYHADGSLTADACPVCDTEGFFNVAGTFGAQMCRHTDDTVTGDTDPDDLWFDALTLIKCGHCNTILYDAEDYPHE